MDAADPGTERLPRVALVHGQERPLAGVVDAPPSKNYTTRLILLAALADGFSVVERPAVQDDSVALVRCLRQFGVDIVARDVAGAEVEFSVPNSDAVARVEVQGFGPRPIAPRETVDTGNAGAVLRFLLAVAALADGEVRFDTAHHKDSLGKRPNRDLLDALAQLGVECEGTGDGGTLPITVRGGIGRMRAHLAARREREGIAPHEPVPVTVSGAVSSQFASAVLQVMPLLDEKVRLSIVDGLKSAPLIELTRSVMGRAGIEVQSSSDRLVHQVDPGQAYRAGRTRANGDWPGSAAIFAAAAVVPGSEIVVRGLQDDEQGEKMCLEFYQAMGCTVTREVEPGVGEQVRFRAPERLLDGARINGDLCTDAVLAMMGAAALANGESRFMGIENLQFKECDRVRDPIEELRRIDENGPPVGTVVARWDQNYGIAWWEPFDKPDTIYVNGSPEGFEGGITVNGCGDHRVIMMLSVVALRCRSGLRIDGAHHVAKSFPGWFDILRALGARVDSVPAKD